MVEHGGLGGPFRMFAKFCEEVEKLGFTPESLLTAIDRVQAAPKIPPERSVPYCMSYGKPSASMRVLANLRVGESVEFAFSPDCVREYQRIK